MLENSQKQGFTLIEAIVSIVLLVMVIGGSYRIMNQTARMIRASRNHYIAANLSNARIERARTFVYSSLPLLAETNIVITDEGSPDSAGDFRRTTIVIPNYQVDTNNPQSGLTMVLVRTEICNLQSRTFTGDAEEVVYLATEYLTP